MPLYDAAPGSAVFDRDNTSGLGVGGTPPLVAMYTTGNTRTGLPVVQSLASSTDRGRTWTKFAGNPVIPFIEGENRDPKVIWHTQAACWMMARPSSGHTPTTRLAM